MSLAYYLHAHTMSKSLIASVTDNAMEQMWETTMWELIWLITSCLAVYTYAKTRSSRVQLRRQAEQLAKLGYRIAQLEKRDTV